MEENTSPIVVGDTEITEEKFALVNAALIGKNSRRLSVLYLIAGIAFILLGALFIATESHAAGGLSISWDGIFVGVCGLLLTAISLFLLTVKKKSGKNGYETYVRLNTDTHIHEEFYSDRMKISNSVQSNTYFYENATSWAESDDLYLIHYGTKLHPLAVFILKDSFSSHEDALRFFELINSAMAGKKYKRLK